MGGGPIELFLIPAWFFNTYFIAYIHLRFKHAVLGTSELCGLFIQNSKLVDFVHC